MLDVMVLVLLLDGAILIDEEHEVRQVFMEGQQIVYFA
jgi:hypothetical protein